MTEKEYTPKHMRRTAEKDCLFNKPIACTAYSEARYGNMDVLNLSAANMENSEKQIQNS